MTSAEPRHGFRITLDNFEGPFDLLLQLIGRHQLDIAEVALEAKAANRCAARGREAHELAARAGDMDLIFARVVCEATRLYARGAAVDDRAGRIDRHEGVAAAERDMDAMRRVFDQASRLGAELERGLGEDRLGREIDLHDAIAIGVGDDGPCTIAGHDHRAAGDRNSERLGRLPVLVTSANQNQWQERFHRHAVTSKKSSVSKPRLRCSECAASRVSEDRHFLHDWRGIVGKTGSGASEICGSGGRVCARTGQRMTVAPVIYMRGESGRPARCEPDRWIAGAARTR